MKSTFPTVVVIAAAIFFGHLLAGGAARDLRWSSHLPQRQSKHLESR
jgi:hypothetical protein